MHEADLPEAVEVVTSIATHTVQISASGRATELVIKSFSDFYPSAQISRQRCLENLSRIVEIILRDQIQSFEGADLSKLTDKSSAGDAAIPISS